MNSEEIKLNGGVADFLLDFAHVIRSNRDELDQHRADNGIYTLAGSSLDLAVEYYFAALENTARKYNERPRAQFAVTALTGVMGLGMALSEQPNVGAALLVYSALFGLTKVRKIVETIEQLNILDYYNAGHAHGGQDIVRYFQDEYKNVAYDAAALAVKSLRSDVLSGANRLIVRNLQMGAVAP